MNHRTRTLLGVALLAVLAVGAGCGEPGAGVTDAGVDETPTTVDNDAGAEPVAPNGTESPLTPTDEPTATRTPQSAVGERDGAESG